MGRRLDEFKERERMREGEEERGGREREGEGEKGRGGEEENQRSPMQKASKTMQEKQIIITPYRFNMTLLFSLLNRTIVCQPMKGPCAVCARFMRHLLGAWRKG